jgi:hypothetical protein
MGARSFIIIFSIPRLTGLSRQYQPQQGLGISGIGQIFFSIGGRHYQLVTICHRFTSFLFKPFFELVPVFSDCLIVGLLQ